VHKLSTARFLMFLILWSIASLSRLLSENPLLELLGGVCFLASIFVGIPSSELHRKVSWNLRETLSSLLWLLVLVGVGAALEYYLGQPVLILSLWLVVVILVCWRRFRGSRSLTGKREVKTGPES
jgi:hypothetical protein